MQIELSYAELHTPIIVGGKNLNLKLDTVKLTGLKLLYDRAEKELLVTYNNVTAIVPSPTVIQMIPAGQGKPVAQETGLSESLLAQAEPPTQEQKEKQAAQAAIQKAAGLGKAQVSTPTSHVFEGVGKK